MIDIENAKQAFKEFIEGYENQDDLGFNSKVVHTYKVAQNAKELAKSLNLTQEDIELAELIGILHDIGRFEELKVTGRFDSISFNHAEYGAEILFEKGLIINFIKENKYDYIIKTAIINHNRFQIEEGLDEKTLLHSKIIRDSDKIDVFRKKQEDKIEEILLKIADTKEEIEMSSISDSVYNSVKNLECVKLRDRKVPLDYYICILAFVFDLNFKISYKIVKERGYINNLIDRFDYKNLDTNEKMKNIKIIMNKFIDENIEECK